MQQVQADVEPTLPGHNLHNVHLEATALSHVLTLVNSLKQSIWKKNVNISLKLFLKVKRFLIPTRLLTIHTQSLSDETFHC